MTYEKVRHIARSLLANSILIDLALHVAGFLGWVS
jgi:hypothetical protein